MRVCFFARVPDASYLERVEFYAQDIRILKDLGHEVVLATRWNEIDWNADLFFVWWWTYAFQPLMAARLKGKPVIITGTFNFRHPPFIDGTDYFRRPAWQRFLLRFALRSANANIFVSKLEEEQVSRHLKTRNPKYIPHIFESEYYHPAEGPKEKLVFVVSWMAEKNAERKCIPEIVKSVPAILAQHPDARIVIGGEKSSGYPAIEQLARELGVFDRISFPGVLSKAEKVAYMQRCSVYLQPTLYEGFGLAILEAMACGAPIVTSRGGAVPEVVGDAGIYVDGKNPAEIAGAVNRLLASKQEVERLSAASLRRANEYFSYPVRKSAIGKVIEEVTGIQAK